tara:strand:- start:125 stop:1510 length:1386 start_codon:yes stop_codon:yes gene_type:complete
MSESVRDLGRNMTDLGRGMSTRFSLPILGIGTMAVKTAADFEKYSIQLKTVTGSQEEASKSLQNLLAFAEKTPYDLEQVIQGFIKLKARGIDPSNEALTSYGNTASAMGKSLDQMIEAVADATTFQFERLLEFGIKAQVEGDKVVFQFGKTRTVVKKNSEDIQKYLRQIGDVNFAAAMTDQMNSLHGGFSNFGDVVTKSLAGLGENLSKQLHIKEVVADFAAMIQRLTGWFLELSPSIQKIIIWLSLFIAMLGPALIVIGQFALGLGWTIKGLIMLKPLLMAVAWIGRSLLIPTLMTLVGAVKMFAVALLTTPAGWFLLAVTAIAGAAYLVIENWSKFKTFFTDLWQGVKSTVTSVIDAVMPYINKFMGAISGVASGVGRVRDFIFGGNEASETATGAKWQPRGPRIEASTPKVNAFGHMDTGGTLNIRIDQDNRARVAGASPNDKRQNFNIENGLLMGGM